MEEDMKANTRKIRNMVLEFTLGRIRDNTKVGGSEVNNMELVYTLSLTKKQNLVFGKKAKELNGLMKKQLQELLIKRSITHNTSKRNKVVNM